MAFSADSSDLVHDGSSVHFPVPGAPSLVRERPRGPGILPVAARQPRQAREPAHTQSRGSSRPTV